MPQKHAVHGLEKNQGFFVVGMENNINAGYFLSYF